MNETPSVVIMGGGGHVGLPLGIAFASRGLDVTLFDIDDAIVEAIKNGELPFREPGAAAVLERVRADGSLRAEDDVNVEIFLRHEVFDQCGHARKHGAPQDEELPIAQMN